MTKPLSRRAFLQGVAGLHLSVWVSRSEVGRFFVRHAALGEPGAPALGPAGMPMDAAADAVEMGIYLAIGEDGAILVTIPRPDMGQGPRTSLAMALAEELEVDWAAVTVIQAPADDRYGNQTSGGSTSTRTFHAPMMRAGATARVMLVRAAAGRWGVDASTCRAVDGAVVHDPTGRRLGYGDLAADAAALPVPPDSEVPLKPPSQYRIVGTPRSRIDNPDVVSGRAVFGSDVRVDGMVVAVVARPPAFGARLDGYDEAAALAVPGVRQVVRVGSGVAVVADHTWAALVGREALAATWDPGPNVGVDDGVISARLRAGLPAPPAPPPAAAKVLDAEYEVPYLAHAPMEPMNCVADAREDRCEVWAPTQAPGSVRSAVAGALGLRASAVQVNVALSGGGFGRRLQTDYATEAARLSRSVGAPVQVVWTRDDDMRHDFYRPASVHAMRGALDAAGNVLMFAHRAALATSGGDLARLATGLPDPDETHQERPPYRIAGLSVEGASIRLPLPTGAWRSVNNTQYTFANEGFLDELAHAAGADPVTFRRALLAEGRLKACFELAVDRFDWTRPMPFGHGRGVACFAGYGSYTAAAVELSVTPTGEVRAHRVVVAIDCGLAVNPRSVEAQIEGATCDGLSTALGAGITVRDGGVVESSYVDFTWLRFDQMPEVEVHIVPSTAQPGGLGEVGFPAVSPAVTNAIFDATGRRLRRLPIRAEDLAGWAPDVPTATATATGTSEPGPTETPSATPTPGTTPSETPEPSSTIYLPYARSAR